MPGTCVPTIQAKWRTFPMTISCHSSLMQTQPFLFYQLVDVYHAVAAFGLSNIVTNFVTLCFYFLIAMYMYILCICPLGHCHNNFSIFTVLGQSVCVCLSTTILALQATKRHQSDTNSSSATSARNLNKRFC